MTMPFYTQTCIVNTQTFYILTFRLYTQSCYTPTFISNTQTFHFLTFRLYTLSFYTQTFISNTQTIYAKNFIHTQTLILNNKTFIIHSGKPSLQTRVLLCSDDNTHIMF